MACCLFFLVLLKKWLPAPVAQALAAVETGIGAAYCL
jgi:hypothetical protein